MDKNLIPGLELITKFSKVRDEYSCFIYPESRKIKWKIEKNMNWKGKYKIKHKNRSNNRFHVQLFQGNFQECINYILKHECYELGIIEPFSHNNLSNEELANILSFYYEKTELIEEIKDSGINFLTKNGYNILKNIMKRGLTLKELIKKITEDIKTEKIKIGNFIIDNITDRRIFETELNNSIVEYGFHIVYVCANTPFQRGTANSFTFELKKNEVL